MSVVALDPAPPTASAAGGAVIATRPVPGNTRNLRVDAAKGIAIILVVLGHARGVPKIYTLLAYSFHVPLFFFLAGWVFRAHATQRRATAVIGRLARVLLMPYVAFFALGWCYWLITRNIGSKALRWGDVPWWDPLSGFVADIGSWQYVHPAIWFLPALFVTASSYVLIHRRAGDAALALAALVACVAWVWWFPPLLLRLPFSLDILPVSLLFYACGAWASQWLRLPRSIAASVLLAACAALPWLVIAVTNGRVDINQLEFGNAAWAFVAASLLGTIAVLALARLGEGQRWLLWIGRNTLLVLCTHILVFFVLSGVASLAGAFHADPPGPGWAVSISVIALLACVPLRWLFDHTAPWAVGGTTAVAGGAR